ncbi:hypothetical protein INT45_010718 [Circinella minor]|uniref:Uncharacterized protein n=1 Tax=Circinella minor TaxID=1195481 RepID=A0A8H7RVD2_9FUNG|nr:hypothetical protein INT45_010718 [Circinella minor]
MMEVQQIVKDVFLQANYNVDFTLTIYSQDPLSLLSPEDIMAILNSDLGSDGSQSPSNPIIIEEAMVTEERPRKKVKRVTSAEDKAEKCFGAVMDKTGDVLCSEVKSAINSVRSINEVLQDSSDCSRWINSPISELFQYNSVELFIPLAEAIATRKF